MDVDDPKWKSEKHNRPHCRVATPIFSTVNLVEIKRVLLLMV